MGKYLGVFSLLDGLLHGLECVSGEFGGDDELAVNVFDLLHHVRLQLGEGLLEPRNPLQGRLGSLSGDMGTGALAAQRLEDGEQVLDGRELVVEDVGPRVTPLLRRGLELGELAGVQTRLRVQVADGPFRAWIWSH